MGAPAASAMQRWEYGALAEHNIGGISTVYSWITGKDELMARSLEDLGAKIEPGAQPGSGLGSQLPWVLQLLGDQGWELITVARSLETPDQTLWIFKRPKAAR